MQFFTFLNSYFCEIFLNYFSFIYSFPNKSYCIKVIINEMFKHKVSNNNKVCNNKFTITNIF